LYCYPVDKIANNRILLLPADLRASVGLAGCAAAARECGGGALS